MISTKWNDGELMLVCWIP